MENKLQVAIKNNSQCVIYAGAGSVFLKRKIIKFTKSKTNPNLTNGIVSWTVFTEMQAGQAVCCLPNAVIRHTKRIVSWVMSSLSVA